MNEEMERQIAEVDSRFFRELVKADCAAEFAALMRDRAEWIARSIPGCQSDRQVAVYSGMLTICYKLADDALAALSAAEADAKVEEAERIRQELAGR